MAMNLQDFFPYRLAVLSEVVSQSLALVYRERFGLTRDEWRVLAALADCGTVKTSKVIEHTTLEKMQVSRAVQRLEEAGLVDRQPDPEDGRGWLLGLTASGRALYRKIVPVVTAREAFLLDALDPAERQALDAALKKVLERARLLNAQG
jgi:DNA-binding MarR family transcriptional regulator